jgi:tRNA threonylcarbamoyladenosine biosynthesis protein TsaB
VIVLALDTCLGACSAALAEDGQILAWRSEAMVRGHQERLALMVGDVMAEAATPFAAVDLVGVTIGPGSFTGLRVGLAFAKGLALALDRPCVGVGTLEALAAGLAGEGPRASVIDAGRGRVYLQLFEGAAPLTSPDIVEVEAALALVAEGFPWGELTLTGPGAALLIGALPRAELGAVDAPDPRVVARLARLAPAAPPRPLYLRPPDAKLPAATPVGPR